MGNREAKLSPISPPNPPPPPPPSHPQVSKLTTQDQVYPFTDDPNPSPPPPPPHPQVSKLTTQDQVYPFTDDANPSPPSHPQISKLTTQDHVDPFTDDPYPSPPPHPQVSNLTTQDHVYPFTDDPYPSPPSHPQVSKLTTQDHVYPFTDDPCPSPPSHPQVSKLTTQDQVYPFTDDPLDQPLVHDFQSINLVKDKDNGSIHSEDKGSSFSPKSCDFGDQYPLRPFAEDCSFYIKTGRCKFGPNCKFNHPLRRSHQDHERGGFAEETKTKWIECKYHLTGEGCKYGAACRFRHSKLITEGAPEKFNSFVSTSQLGKQEKDEEWSAEQSEHVECKHYQTLRGCKYGEECNPLDLDLNFLGLPIRPLERECSFYMRTGSCKYGVNCRFHHPDPTTVEGSSPLNSNGATLSMDASWGNGTRGYNASRRTGSMQNRASRSSSNLASNKVNQNFNSSHSSNASMMHLHPGCTQLKPEWSLYQVSRYPHDNKKNVYSSHPRNSLVKTDETCYPDQIQSEEYPERPGQPECTHFMKTGNCKYKLACRYDHPKDRTSHMPACTLSSQGLPLRPDKKICQNYEQFGICKFGRDCLFDHPENQFSLTSNASSFLEPSPVSFPSDSDW